MEIIKKKAILSFVAFVICLTKYYLFNVLQIFPIYGRENSIVSWFVIMPVILIGCCLALNIILNYFLKKEKIYY